ncbi:hypothetical protein [Polynucleobacter sp. MWH-Svant-W18]|nr:hypothetical protein [Polynucleobacter sp. MWH-Svant-W18]
MDNYFTTSFIAQSLFRANDELRAGLTCPVNIGNPGEFTML